MHTASRNLHLQLHCNTTTRYHSLLSVCGASNKVKLALARCASIFPHVGCNSPHVDVLDSSSTLQDASSAHCMRCRPSHLHETLRLRRRVWIVPFSDCHLCMHSAHEHSFQHRLHRFRVYSEVTKHVKPVRFITCDVDVCIRRQAIRNANCALCLASRSGRLDSMGLVGLRQFLTFKL